MSQVQQILRALGAHSVGAALAHERKDYCMKFYGCAVTLFPTDLAPRSPQEEARAMIGAAQ